VDIVNIRIIYCWAVQSAACETVHWAARVQENLVMYLMS